MDAIFNEPLEILDIRVCDEWLSNFDRDDAASGRMARVLCNARRSRSRLKGARGAGIGRRRAARARK